MSPMMIAGRVRYDAQKRLSDLATTFNLAHHRIMRSMRLGVEPATDDLTDAIAAATAMLAACAAVETATTLERALGPRRPDETRVHLTVVP